MEAWGDVARREPALAERGAALLYQFGVGLAFLATVRADGGPRVHPLCPLLTERSMYAFVVPSPKQRDLRRDPRYALHSFPRPDDEDACYVTGHAVEVREPGLRSRLAAQFARERQQFGVPEPAEDHALFELLVASMLLTTTAGHGDHAPVHTVWHA